MDLNDSWFPSKRRLIKLSKKKKILERAKGICEVERCTNEIVEQDEIHHIIPKEFGGNDDLNNLAIICKKCHLKISQYHQRVLVWIDQHERLIFNTYPPISLFQRQKTEKEINDLKKNFLNEYKFKNRLL